MIGENKLSKTIISFLGAPGCGKGTLATLCKEELGFEVLSTGDLCRSVIASGSELGKKIKAIIDEGHLVSDDMIVEMVSVWLKEKVGLKRTIILDGFPRTVVQAQAFVNMLKSGKFDLDFRIFAIRIEDEIIVERLANREVCPSCKTIYSTLPDSPFISKVEGICDRCGSDLVKREDDKEETVIDRLRVYAQHESGLLDFYKSAGVPVEFLNIEKGVSTKDVFEDLKKSL